MPIYFGNPIEGRQKVSDALRARNLNLVRTSPSQFKISLIPTAILFAYQLVISILSHFLSSVAHNKVIPVGQCLATLQLPHLLPVQLPPLALAIDKDNAGIAESFIGMGFTQQIIRDKKILLKDRPTIEDVQMALNNPAIHRTCDAPWRYVNMEGMKAFLTIRKVATLFLGLSIKPAFSSDDEVRAFLDQSSNVKTPAAKDAEASSSKAALTTAPYSWNWERFGGNLQVRSNNAAVECAAGYTNLNNGFFDVNTLLGALTLPGLFFPFVGDLAREDLTGPTAFIQRHAFHTLGDSYNTCLTKMAEIRSGWGVLRKTVVGDQLAHLFRCFELAIEGQAVVGAIITNKGRYDGCVVLGTGYRLMVKGVVGSVLGRDALHREISDFGSHDKALDRIMTAIHGDMVDTMDDDAEWTSPEYRPKSSYQLRYKIHGCNLSEEKRDVIRQWFPYLDFDEQQWGINADTLEKLLDQVAIGEIEDGTPLTVHGIFDPNVANAMLSAFGSVACPSFRVRNGRKISMRAAPPVPKMKVITNRKRKQTEISVDDFEQTIQAQAVPYSTAVSDFKDMVVDGCIRVCPLDSRPDTVRVYKGAERGALWSSLARVCQDLSAERRPSGLVPDVQGEGAIGGLGSMRREDAGRTMAEYL